MILHQLLIVHDQPNTQDVKPLHYNEVLNPTTNKYIYMKEALIPLWTFKSIQVFRMENINKLTV